MTSAFLLPHTSGNKEHLSPWLPWVYLVFYQITFFYIFSKNKIKQRTNIWKYTRPQRLCVCMSMNDCKKYFFFFFLNVHDSSYLSIYYSLLCTLMEFIDKNQEKIELTKRKVEKKKTFSNRCYCHDDPKSKRSSCPPAISHFYSYKHVHRDYIEL